MDYNNQNIVLSTQNTYSRIPKESLSKTGLQRLTNWLVFFLAFPCVNILSNSITFYIFILIIIKVGSFWFKSFREKTLLFSFLGIVILTSIIAPYGDMPRHPGIFYFISTNIRYI